MRWVVFCFAALLSVSPAAAQEAATIKVTVRDYSGALLDKKGIDVVIAKWPRPEDVQEDLKGTRRIPTTETKQGLTATVTDSEKTPLPPGTYEIRVKLTDNVETSERYTTFATQIVHVGEGDKLDIVLDSSNAMALGYEAGSAFENAADAKAKGSTEYYKISADQIRQGLRQDQRLVDEAAAAAEAFARDNGLRVTNLAGAQKDLKQLQKLGALGDQDKKASLERYIEQLQAVEQMRQKLDDNKQRFAELEERKFSLLPSACPEGQSGGLLAGGINSLFGTDLAGVCDDQQPQHRDTEREKRDHHDRHERD